MRDHGVRSAALGKHTVLTFCNACLLLAKLQISATVEDCPYHDVLAIAKVFDAVLDREERRLTLQGQQLNL